MGLWNSSPQTGLAWLSEDLERVAPDVPVVIYFHYPLAGVYAENNWFGRGSYRDDFEKRIKGWNVVGIFHGHYHASGRYRWRGYDVYNVGSPKHAWHSFAVVHVRAGSMDVASYDYERREWGWWHHKTWGDGGAQRSSARRGGKTSF